MGEKYLTLSEINLEGQFLGFAGKKPHKSKHLRLAVPAGKIKINIPEDLRDSILAVLLPGEQISVNAISKLNLRNSKVKLTAYQVEAAGFCPIHHLLTETQPKIMVCQKSGCMKRGGKGFLSELEQTLCDRGLIDKVQIEHTDCQKTCGSAPNCILTVGKKQYKKVHPSAIASLLEEHLGNH
jgi:hypothetical protein